MWAEYFKMSAPDCDGEMSSEVEVLVNNPTKATVDRVIWCAVLRDNQGYVVDSHGRREDVSLAPRENVTLRLGWIVDTPPSTDAQRDMRLRVSATLYARESHVLGSVDVPSGDYEWARLSKSIKSKLVEGKLRLGLFRDAPSDGEVRLTFHMGLERRCEDPVEASLQVAITDRNGRSIDSTSSRLELCAHESVMTGWIGVRRSKLKGARFEFKLSLFRPVHVLHCEAVGSPDEE